MSVTRWSEFLKEGKRAGERLRDRQRQSFIDAIFHFKKPKDNEIQCLGEFRGRTERDI